MDTYFVNFPIKSWCPWAKRERINFNELLFKWGIKSCSLGHWLNSLHLCFLYLWLEQQLVAWRSVHEFHYIPGLELTSIIKQKLKCRNALIMIISRSKMTFYCSFSAMGSTHSNMPVKHSFKIKWHYFEGRKMEKHCEFIIKDAWPPRMLASLATSYAAIPTRIK